MLRHWFDLMAMTAECQTVVALRISRLMMGGAAAEEEAALMVTEKVAAAGAAALTLWSGGGLGPILRDYRGRVRKNRRRLSAPPKRRR